MVKFSVIIPVYNAENYIEKCINSLLSQTLSEGEFIFINDGSSDGSKSIIESYQQQDARIILINQKNQGVSAARNKGLEIAKGEFIGFVDGDDFVEKEMYEKLYQTAKKNQTDITVSNFIMEHDSQKIISNSYFPTDTIFDKKNIQENIIPFFIREDGLNSTCNKIYRKSLIIQNGIDFPVGVAHGEDAMFNLNLFNKAENVIFMDYAGYNYREVDGSASRDLSKDYFQKALEMFEFDYKSKLNLSLDTNEINDLKSIRFINTVISLIHIYLKPNNKMSFRDRYCYVKRMIDSEVLQNVIIQNWKSNISNKSRYNKFILKSIKAKSTFRLMLATSYSNFRNKK